MVVSRDQLTNDLDIAASVARIDYRNQSAISRQIGLQINAVTKNAGDRAELARQGARLEYLNLEKVKMEHALAENPRRLQADDVTLKKLSSLKSEIERTVHQIEEMNLKIRADEEAEKNSAP